MKATFFIAVVAVCVATVSAAGGQDGGKRIDTDQKLGGIGNEGRVSGLVNNLLKAGILADDSKDFGDYQDAF
ncbi:uncharacterized protein BYT42DRAFT_618673 [Radiomyces spectabilis]|uniref:uncharacterized protein n=1 Tax=Radiomyces spectabilis TaxID=64574 RepID=UPI00221E86BA|nr:uncharacterized protein BYT42DRAFT_618673 [Radiomyces spectabilis]KAI8365293.1 hypothetical protein BYT42DRAFT_618673 [Radiomyces spectabilis]